MQLIHELSWLWKGIGIIALASAIVLIAAFKLHKEECKIEIACIIFIVTILIGIKEWKRVIQSMRESLKNDCGGASIFFVYSLAATITVILLEICQMMDTSIESHFSLVECLIITFISFLRFLRRQERTIEKIINLDENKHKERNQT